MDEDEKATREFCELLNRNVARAVFGYRPQLH